MKKKMIALLLMLVIGIFPFAISSITVFADIPSDTIVPANCEAVYSGQGNYLPSIFSDKYSYNVSIYNYDDNEYSHPIAENVVMIYTFAKPGTYRLKYALKNLETNELSYAYSVFTVIDTEIPKLFINGAYQDYYDVGVKVVIFGVSIYDNADSDLTEYSYKVWLNGTDITSNITDGSLTIKGGSYEIVYTASDKSGNIGSVSAYFSGGNGGDSKNSDSENNASEENSGSCSSSIGLSPIGGICLLAIAIFAYVMMTGLKHKGVKKDEKGE